LHLLHPDVPLFVVDTELRLPDKVLTMANAGKAIAAGLQLYRRNSENP
jgi:hypothetical protein